MRCLFTRFDEERALFWGAPRRLSSRFGEFLGNLARGPGALLLAAFGATGERARAEHARGRTALRVELGQVAACGVEARVSARLYGEFEGWRARAVVEQRIDFYPARTLVQENRAERLAPFDASDRSITRECYDAALAQCESGLLREGALSDHGDALSGRNFAFQQR